MEPSAVTPKRLIWPDVARGIAVALVVFHHVTIKDLVLHADNPASADVLDSMQLAFSSIRMPLFFIISGMFASSIMRRPLRVLLRDRTAYFYYLYVVWLTIQTVVFVLLRTDVTIVANSALDLLGQLTVAPSTLWYLWALAVYFPLTRVFLRHPGYMLTAAVLTSIWAGSSLFPTWGNLPSAGRNLVWFVAGVTLSAHILRFSERRYGWWIALAASAVVAGNLWQSTLPKNVSAFTQLPLSLLGAATGIAVATLVARRFRRLASACAWVGGRTLQVYVLHLPVLAGILAIRQSILGSVHFDGWTGAVYGVLISAVLLAVTVTLPLQRLAPWLITAPWRRRTK
ncbi:acyltransferase family protein [Microbacterium enclense]|uniref:acyltransferase family protein n=1 Tax=Microbacterium enclense TaxID=993073 RepID=UPI003F7D66CD